MDVYGSNWPSKRVWKTVESQGKVSESQGIFKWILSGNPGEMSEHVTCTVGQFKPLAVLPRDAAS